MSESVELLTQIDTAEDRDTLEEAFLGRPDSHEFNGLFAQIDIWHQSISKNEVPETSICENVTRILTTPLWELSFGGQKSECTVNYIGRRPQQQQPVSPGHHFVKQILTF